MAARLRTPIRINHATLEYGYARVMREGIAADALERAIPLPGLERPGSQLALPLVTGGQLLGVMFAESTQDMRFDWDDEDALVALAAQVSAHALVLQRADPPAADDVEPEGAAALECAEGSVAAPAMRVRYYEADGSVFIDDDYVIKGVAGRVLWKLLGEHAQGGRTEFTNRELRLAPEIRLPEVGDNLEARLALLTRRLADRQVPVRLDKPGRGRLRLCLTRPVQLLHVPG